MGEPLRKLTKINEAEFKRIQNDFPELNKEFLGENDLTPKYDFPKLEKSPGFQVYQEDDGNIYIKKDNGDTFVLDFGD